jgi:hypothetical protein
LANDSSTRSCAFCDHTKVWRCGGTGGLSLRSFCDSGCGVASSYTTGSTHSHGHQAQCTHQTCLSNCYACS